MNMFAISPHNIIVCLELSIAYAAFVLAFSMPIFLAAHFVDYSTRVANLNSAYFFLQSKHAFIVELIFINVRHSIIVEALLVISPIAQFAFQFIVA